VVGSGIIEVHRSLDQTEPKHPDVKIEVPLRVTRDGGDMMDAADFSHAVL
jgi:hypothetical protein